MRNGSQRPRLPGTLADGWLPSPISYPFMRREPKLFLGVPGELPRTSRNQLSPWHTENAALFRNRAVQAAEEGAEFGGGFVEFGFGVGGRDDAAAAEGAEGAGVGGEFGAADGHVPVAVAGGVAPADRAAVEAAVAFQVGDGFEGQIGRGAADGGGGVEQDGQIEGGDGGVAEFAADGGGQVPDLGVDSNSGPSGIDSSVQSGVSSSRIQSMT